MDTQTRPDLHSADTASKGDDTRAVDDPAALAEIASRALARAEKLAQANALLRDCAERLGRIDDIDEFLGQVLLAMTEMVGAHSSTVWTYDLVAWNTRLRYVVEGGRAVPASLSDHPNAGAPIPLPANAAVVTPGHGTARAQPHQRRVAESPGLNEEQRRYLLGLGIVSIISVPMALAGQHIGDFTLRLTDEQPLLDDERELIMALANQAAVALHLTQLAEQAKQAAVAVEREAAAKARAEKLAQANALLRDSAERLGALADIDAFLGQVLLSITQLLGATSSTVWVDNEDHTLSWLRFVVEEGRALPAAASSHPNALIPGNLNAENTAVLRGYGTAAAEPVLHEVAITTGMESDVQRDYLLSLGVKALLTVPMVLNGQHLGNFNIRVTDDSPLLDDERELIMALASQAAVALHLTRLAEQAKQAAIAVEREAAAKARAERLAQANALLRESAERLGAIADIDAFLGQVLLTICGIVEGLSATVWTHDAASNLSTLRYVVENGLAVPAAASGHPNAHTPAVTVHTSPMGPVGMADAVPYLQLLEDLVDYTEEQRGHLRATGAQALLAVPMVLRGEQLGSFTVRLASCAPLLDDERELIQALGNQAAVALHLTQLAEQAKQVAVAREQEAAAKARAEKLSVANQLLRRSAESLGDIEDIDAYLGEVLWTIHELLSSHSATVWLFDNAAALAHLRFVVEDGRVLPAVESKHPNATTPHAISPVADHLMPGYGTPTAVPIQTPTCDARAFTPAQRTYFEGLGIRSVVSVPMTLRGEHLGNFTLRLTDDRPLLDDEREMIQALANQAAVALHLTRLAEQARQAAVAREKEQAAREQVAELERANAAISRTIDALAREHSVDAFLATTMKAMAEALDTPSMTMWRYEEGFAKLHLVLEQGEVRAGEDSSHPNAQKPVPLSSQPHVFAADGSLERTPRFIRLGEGAMWSPAQMDHLRSHGVRALVDGSMVVDDRVIGSFTARIMEGQPDPTPARMSLVQALTNQAALALEMTRLAQEAQAAEVTRERLAVVSRANEALRRTADKLADEPTLDKFLGQALQALVEAFGGMGGTLWRWDGEGVVLALEMTAGELKQPAQTGHPHMRHVPTKPHALEWEARMRSGDIVAVDVDRDYHFEPEAQAYLRGMGVGTLVMVPLNLGDRHLGRFTLRLAASRALAGEELELARALATQAALAMELTRLADEAKQAAIAREQEQAARAQVAELERANTAISRTIDALAREHSVDAFLATTMQAMAEALETPSMTMWLYRDDVMDLHLVYENGRTTPGDESGHPNAGKPIPNASNHWKYNGDGTLRRQPFIYRVGEDGLWTKEQVQYLRAQSVRALVEGVMVVDDRVVGTFTARLTDSQPDPTPARMSLVQALTNQAALALEMTRLAQESQAAEVTRERLAVVSRANEALRRTADKLADEPALDAFLGHALQALAEAFGAEGGTFWRWDGTGIRLALELHLGALQHPPATDHPDTLRPQALDRPDVAEVERQQRDGEVVVLDVEAGYGLSPDIREYLQARGVATLVCMPLNLAGRHLGRFTVRLSQPRTLSQEELELARALSTQAALAMELTRLADEAKQAAIAREQERAAREQVAELERANAAISRTIDALAREHSVDAFLATTMKAMADALDAPSLAMWLYRDGLSHLHLLHEDGLTVLGAQSDHPNARTPNPLHLQSGAYAADGSLRRTPTFRLLGGADANWLPAQIEHLRSRGVRGLVEGIMVVDDLVIGSFTARVLEGQPDPTPARMSLVQALTNQAALALEMTRLAQEAQAAEVTRERLAVVSRANDALRRTADKLADEPALEAFLGQALQALVEAFGGFGGGFWRRAEDGLVELVLELDHGVLRVIDQTAHPVRQGENLSNPDNAAHERRLLAGDILSFDVERDFGFEPQTQAYLLNAGVTALVIVPLSLGDRHLGRFSIRFDAVRALTAEDVELARALATQAALAMELVRLADKAKQAAISREQEQAASLRADTLARANTAIRATLDKLAEQQDLNAFLGEAVVICANELGAVGAGIWLNHADDSPNELILSYEDGELRPVARMQHPGTDNHLVGVKQTRLNDADLVRGEIVVEAGETLRQRPWYPAYRNYLEARGIVAIASLPLFIGSRWAGTVVLRHTSVPDFPQEKRELAQALGNQIALALELTRLADEARQAALAREREQAVLEQVAELSRANLAMRESLDEIAQATDLESLRPTVLGSLMKALGAVGGSLWRYNADDGSVTLDQEFAGGRFLSRGDSGFQHAERHHFMPSHPPSYEKHQRLIRGETLVMDVATTDMFVLNEREHLLAQGVRMLVVTPIEAAGRHLGRLALAFAEARELSAAEFELARALTNQAGLVLEATRLAEEARHAAVSREKEAAARTRAEELAFANDSMSRIIALQASTPDVDAVLAHALGVLCRTVGGTSGTGTLWLNDHAAGMSHLRFVLEDGAVIDGAKSRHPNASLSMPLASQPWTDHVPAISLHSVSVEARYSPEQVAYLGAFGVAALLLIPLNIGGQTAGTFTVRMPVAAYPPQPVMQLAETIAQQATLALQSHRLAAQAMQAAVSQERALAAQARADELMDANAALRRSLDALASDEDVNRFLGATLGEIGSHAPSSPPPRVLLWRAFDGEAAARYQLCWTAELAAGIEVEGCLAPDAAEHLLQALPALRGQRDAVRLPIEPGALFSGAACAALTAAGVRSLLHLPLLLGDGVLGAVAVLFADPDPIAPEAVALMQAFAHQATLAIRLAELSAQSRNLAVLEERARLARDIHDGIVQSFIGIQMQLQGVAAADASGAIDRALKLSQMGVTESRRAVKALRPWQLVGRSFQDAVSEMAEAALGPQVQWKITSSGTWPAMAPDVEGQLFRVVQEALNNIAKHAHASRVTVELSATRSERSILISDNGRGFDTPTPEAEGGFGLFSMQQRAQSIGARLQVVSRPGQGTQVFISL
jgi:GAF domain-containing protein